MIVRVHFENFKSLASLAIPLERITALVGANGCGKSSVLQGMHLLSQHAVEAPSDAPAIDHRLMYRGEPGRLVLGVQASDGGEFRLEARRAAGQMVPDTITSPLASQRALAVAESLHGPLASQRALGATAYLHLDAAAMTRTTLADDERPRMAPDGSGLASALAWMKGAAEDEFAQLIADLRRVVPGVKRIRTLRERVKHRRMEKLEIDGQPIWRPVDETLIGDRFAIEFDDGSEVPADLLSEGTVLALGLLAKLREPGRPRLVLLDDIDRGLHLAAQVRLVEALRELMKLDPELQIVCTTHSPYLLDLFDPSEVRVLALDSERRTHARPLTEHPEFDRWKFGTQTGELWAALGESWVISGATG
jgi:predicted ATPase